MGSADVAGLEPLGEMLFREILHSWTLDGQLMKQKWQLKIGQFGRFSQVGQQVQIMHDAFHDDDDSLKSVKYSQSYVHLNDTTHGFKSCNVILF